MEIMQPPGRIKGRNSIACPTVSKIKSTDLAGMVVRGSDFL